MERYVRFENVSYSLALVLVAFCEIFQVLLNFLTKKGKGDAYAISMYGQKKTLYYLFCMYFLLLFALF